MHRTHSAVLLLLVGGRVFVASGQAPAKGCFAASVEPLRPANDF